MDWLPVYKQITTTGSDETVYSVIDKAKVSKIILTNESANDALVLIKNGTDTKIVTYVLANSTKEIDFKDTPVMFDADIVVNTNQQPLDVTVILKEE